MADEPDRERNRLSGRISRYARVGANVGGAAVQMAAARLFGRDLSDPKNAALLVQALGGLKGPVMKMAQLAATIPDMLPPEYAAELQTLQASAPPMGPSFVKRRMMVELGAGWEKKFQSFDREPAAAASLGQVHRAVGHDGRQLACKLQYPDMESAVAADLSQLNMILGIQRRMSPELDTTEIAKEIGDRLKEELDYKREAQHIALYRQILAGDDLVRVPEPMPALSTARLLTMSWLEGTPLLSHKEDSLEDRNRISEAVFHAWWHPFARFGVIHGDPHLGNYTIFAEGGVPGGLNLLDYGCIRIFPATFVEGVIDLYHGLRDDEPERVIHAYEGWGFKNLTKSTIETLNVWARFIYAPLLDDRVRTIADGVEPQHYGRREVWEVKQRLKPESAITIPREFVLMDRAAIGIGSVFLHLRAEMNFHRMFEEAIDGFSAAGVAKRQLKALKGAGLVRGAAP